jgi:hypothetical protein
VDTAFAYIETTIRVTKPGDPAIGEVLSECDFRVRAYRTAARSGSPAWDSHQSTLGGCLPAKIHRWPLEAIPPGQFTLSVPVRAFLGDSLPQGRYYFTVSINPNARLDHDPNKEILAGSADVYSRHSPDQSQ